MKIFQGDVECEVSVVINMRKIVNRFLNDLIVKWQIENYEIVSCYRIVCLQDIVKFVKK